MRKKWRMSLKRDCWASIETRPNTRWRNKTKLMGQHLTWYKWGKLRIKHSCTPKIKKSTNCCLMWQTWRRDNLIRKMALLPYKEVYSACLNPQICSAVSCFLRMSSRSLWTTRKKIIDRVTLSVYIRCNQTQITIPNFLSILGRAMIYLQSISSAFQMGVGVYLI